MSITGFTQSELIAMMSDQNTSNYKKYFEYDANANVTFIYIAQTEAVVGDDCLRCRLEYKLISGSYYVEKMDYDTSSWATAYDI